MQSPADEWVDAVRSARNALIGWTLVGLVAFAIAGWSDDIESVSVFIGSMMVGFASCAVLYGLWRLYRLLVIRKELLRAPISLGRVFVALVSNPLPRNLHELVLVWLQDPRVEEGRLRRPDLRYMADLSEDDQVDPFEEPVVREAWTRVRSDGRPRTGRWFRTADNLILVMRRGGPLIWLATIRGLRGHGRLVPCREGDLAPLQGIDRPVGFRGLARAIAWRFIIAVALAVLGLLSKE